MTRREIAVLLVMSIAMGVYFLMLVGLNAVLDQFRVTDIEETSSIVEVCDEQET